jgi:uncharacterized OB-fold protein
MENRITGGIGADDPYWQALEDGSFRLPRCAACQRWIWPAHHRCGTCGSWDQEWVPVEPAGTIYAWTRTHYSFDRVRERADQIPYVVALTEIPAAGNTRVLGVVHGDDSGVRIGAPVRGVILPPSPTTKGYGTITWVLEDGADQQEGGR